ncbi:MAG: type II toxin-antitoxin system prevent-host-death family antitoxin [Acidobacteriota bacterium]
MSRTGRKGAEEARNQLPDLLEAARKGRSTIITKHGRPIAALVPVDELVDRSAQRSLLSWRGTGRGLWGKNSTRALQALRDEWGR